jgi:hypothetical protein
MQNLAHRRGSIAGCPILAAALSPQGGVSSASETALPRPPLHPSAATGSVNVNTDPCPNWLVTEIDP